MQMMILSILHLNISVFIITTTIIIIIITTRIITTITPPALFITTTPFSIIITTPILIPTITPVFLIITPTVITTPLLKQLPSLTQNSSSPTLSAILTTILLSPVVYESQDVVKVPEAREDCLTSCALLPDL